MKSLFILFVSLQIPQSKQSLLILASLGLCCNSTSIKGYTFQMELEMRKYDNNVSNLMEDESAELDAKLKKYQEESIQMDAKLKKYQEESIQMDAKIKKYLRGDGADLEALQNKKLKGRLALREDLHGKSAKIAAKTEKWLMPSEGGYLEADGMEKTWRIRQETIANEVGILSSRNQYDIVLPELGPYTINFAHNGRHIAVAGRKGHLAIVDTTRMELVREFQVRETVRDVVFLHNELFYAAAQKKYAYIYNQDGTELHCLKEHGPVRRLQFLRNHFLLATVNTFGQLRYQDVTSGQMAACFGTRMGRSDAMEVNPYNSVVGLGHPGGKVTMWKPTSPAPVVAMLCHHGPVSALAFHPGGRLLATSGADRKIKLWDLRKHEVVQTFFGHARSLCFSQRGLLAAAMGSRVKVRRDGGGDGYGDYMDHWTAKGFQVGRVVFRPYEDVLGIGHSAGWSSILVPGAGEPNFDSWVANPFETRKQRREKEVRSLLEKLPPESIMVDPGKIGTVREEAALAAGPTTGMRQVEMDAAVVEAKGAEMKRKAKGGDKPRRKMKRKREAVARVKRPFLEEKLKLEVAKAERVADGVRDDLPKSLRRFVQKKPGGAVGSV